MPPDSNSSGRVKRTAFSVPYVAELKHVREVSLAGTTDFEFWFDYLRPEELAPARYGDAAQLLIMASEMAYLGIRFTEVSFGVHVALAGEGGRQGMRRWHAFISSRMFAWCERTLFAMPHSCAKCQVSAQSPVLLSVRAADGFAVRAEMSPPARAPTFLLHEQDADPKQICQSHPSDARPALAEFQNAGTASTLRGCLSCRRRARAVSDSISIVGRS